MSDVVKTPLLCEGDNGFRVCAGRRGRGARTHAEKSSCRENSSGDVVTNAVKVFSARDWSSHK